MLVLKHGIRFVITKIKIVITYLITWFMKKNIKIS